MIHTTAVVIGAGHAGLAMSRRLTERSIDHVVLERGEVSNSGDRRVHPAGHPGRRRRRPPLDRRGDPVLRGTRQRPACAITANLCLTGGLSHTDRIPIRIGVPSLRSDTYPVTLRRKCRLALHHSYLQFRAAVGKGRS